MVKDHIKCIGIFIMLCLAFVVCIGIGVLIGEYIGIVPILAFILLGIGFLTVLICEGRK